jgi:Sec-independent protein translocase protein TatA
MNTKSSRSSHDRHTRTCNDFWSSSTSFWGKQTSGTGPSMGSSVGEFKKAQTESERNLREYEKSLKEPTAAKSKIQETAEKLGIDIKGKTDDQLLDEIQKSAEKPKEVFTL